MTEPTTGGENIRDSVNLEYNVHKHLDRMSGIITNPNLNEDRYNWAIEHLLALLYPYIDDEFDKKLNEIRDYFDGPVTGKKPKDDDFSTVVEIRAGGAIEKAKTTQLAAELIKQRNRLIFKEVNDLMKRLNIGFEQRGYEDIGGFEDEYNNTADK